MYYTHDFSTERFPTREACEEELLSSMDSLDISEFLALPQFEGWTDLEFCEWMIREIGVAAVPGSSFFREPVNHLIRLHFAREQSVLEEAIRRLSRLSEL